MSKERPIVDISPLHEKARDLVGTRGTKSYKVDDSIVTIRTRGIRTPKTKITVRTKEPIYSLGKTLFTYTQFRSKGKKVDEELGVMRQIHPGVLEKWKEKSTQPDSERLADTSVVTIPFEPNPGDYITVLKKIKTEDRVDNFDRTKNEKETQKELLRAFRAKISQVIKNAGEDNKVTKRYLPPTDGSFYPRVVETYILPNWEHMQIYIIQQAFGFNEIGLRVTDPHGNTRTFISYEADTLDVNETIKGKKVTRPAKIEETQQVVAFLS